ncbi:HD domain-containing protein [Desulfovibrio porci]|uniref:HD domain-containing protein n=1 Tax=Desulfovibrio porci TaxID=2605782 RepID=UPI0012B3867A|nr:HD domain-containing protein [Desulfovibrio porci]MDY3809149.1 HD domain-containing protein [Desulfovibrio porci]
MELYLVGGAVRDLLLGRVPVELDFAFSGAMADFLAAHPDARPVGKSVRVCLWRGRECMPLRGGSLEADLLARDLTVNAMALDSRGLLRVHPQALADLRSRRLRPASPTALSDDPARVFRLARFAASWPDWQVDGEACAQMRALLPSALAAIPAERVGRELRKALAAPAPARFLETLAAGNALVPWFAELETARDIPAGPARWHKNSVLGHTARIMNLTAGDPLAVWMALCHDLGKIGTDPALLPHHYGHEQRGIALAQGLAERLRLPALFSKAGALAAAEHMKAGMLPRLRPGTRRDLLWRVHQAGLSAPFWRLADADSNSRVGTEALRQLAALLAVRLPPDWWGKGELSARKLRELHCRALTELPALPDPSA